MKCACQDCNPPDHTLRYLCHGCGRTWSVIYLRQADGTYEHSINIPPLLRAKCDRCGRPVRDLSKE